MADNPADIPLPPPEPPAQNTEPEHSDKAVSSALNLSWTFGMNRKIPVINLSDGSRTKIIYAAGHTAVMYDYVKNEQTLLQGHANAISCTCVSADKKWVVTADRGDDNLLVVWDSHTGTPVRTIFDPHPDGGIAAVAMTPDAKYVATLSAADTQTLAIWDWTVESDEPVCTAELEARFGLQTYLHFNPEDTTQIVSNSDTQVVFYSWKEGKVEYFAPPLTDDDFNKQVGKYSMSIFLHNSTRALTATSLGNLVTWDTNKPLTKVKSNEPTPDKKATKLVKLQDRSLNVLTTTDNFIVTGDALGHIKFFDQTLKLVNWYQDFNLGPVNAISFAYCPEWDAQFSPDNKFPPDATIQARPFVVRDFVVGTTSSVYARVTTDGTDISVIHREHDSAIHCLAAHPAQPHIAIGSYSGYLKVWDYEKKQTVVSRHFERGMIRCCTYDPKGQYICIGFINGAVRVVDAISLIDMCSEPFRYARDAITHVAFSHDSKWMATADAEFTLSLYKRPDEQSEEAYTYIGRYKAHYKLIVDLCFGIQLDSDQPRLLSLGEDRVLVEYDLEQTQKDHIVIASSDRIEQSAVPMCMTWYPPVTKESFILTSNDQYKFKLYNATTKMCRKTLLGPTFGSPIQKIVILPTANPVTDKRYTAYITADKIGLHKLPLDGNPHNAMAQISHPQGVVNLVCSNDGKYLFTAGGLDTVVHMWDINLSALEAQSKLGGDDLIPFYGLLDGGRDGELFKELEDYFYYAQLRSQGVDTTESRNVSSKIALTQVPFVMRALGFYPSEQEIEDMLNEVKYSNYVETGQYTTDIELGDLIKLYVNHRPAFGLQPEKLLWAFDVLGRDSIEPGTVDRGDLLTILQNKGEHITEYELAEYLTTLLGFNEEGGSSELHQFDPSTAGDLIEQHLPQDINADMFANEILGFGLYADSNQGSAAQSQSQLA